MIFILILSIIWQIASTLTAISYINSLTLCFSFVTNWYILLLSFATIILPSVSSFVFSTIETTRSSNPTASILFGILICHSLQYTVQLY